jgi:hypothetical protein
VNQDRLKRIRAEEHMDIAADLGVAIGTANAP